MYTKISSTNCLQYYTAVVIKFIRLAILWPVSILHQKVRDARFNDMKYSLFVRISFYIARFLFFSRVCLVGFFRYFNSYFMSLVQFRVTSLFSTIKMTT